MARRKKKAHPKKTSQSKLSTSISPKALKLMFLATEMNQRGLTPLIHNIVTIIFIAFTLYTLPIFLYFQSLQLFLSAFFLFCNDN